MCQWSLNPNHMGLIYCGVTVRKKDFRMLDSEVLLSLYYQSNNKKKTLDTVLGERITSN